MNKFRKLFLAFAAASMVLSSCNSDGPDVSKSSEKEGAFHATLTLSLPAGSRSATVDPEDEPAKSSAGFEVGNESENFVGTVVVVLASKDADTYTYITKGSSIAIPTTTSGNPIYNLTFSNSDLIEKAGEEVYVFAYCNPSQKLTTKLGTLKLNDSFTNLEGNITEASISSDNNFLMTNASITPVTLPSKDLMENYYDKRENPFFLGIVKVERATARFDFRETKYGNLEEPNRYPIENANSDIMGYVQLDGMALLNEAKNYYYLPRVSDNGFEKTESNVIICGQETPSNYVVSPGSTQKTKYPLDLEWLGENYTCVPTYTTVYDKTASNFAGLDYKSLSEGRGDDDDNNWTVPSGNNENYHIWKYVSENTIPSYLYNDIADYQRKGVSTGVVFKGYLVAADESNELGHVIKNGSDIIYAYQNVIYGNLEMLKKAVKEDKASALAEVFNVAFQINSEELTDDEIENVRTDLVKTIKNGFTIYRPDKDDGKYYMYYTYYNRHNDNGKNTFMGPMEFSVVRNNVYKLSVENILAFGHPGDPTDDPDPENPDDPDETPKTYFSVQVQVLPWVVRVNSIIL